MTYARLLHDFQRADMECRPGSKSQYWNGKSNPPETVTLSDESKRLFKGHKIPITQEYKDLLLKINGKRAYKAIMIPDAGWINFPPNAESLSFGGNLIDIDRVEGDWNRIRALSFTQVPQTSSPLDYWNYPQYIHKFCAVRKRGGFLKLGIGLDAYIPLMKYSELWIHRSRIEKFPEIPPGGLAVQVTARGSLFASGDLHVRLQPNPSGYVLGALNYGDIANIVNYQCSGPDVWAQI